MPDGPVHDGKVRSRGVAGMFDGRTAACGHAGSSHAKMMAAARATVGLAKPTPRLP
jgi:hypothetical protein